MLSHKEQIDNLIQANPLCIQEVSNTTQWLKTKLDNPQNLTNFDKELFSYEIKESAIENVIILDERLWKQFKNSTKATDNYYQQGQQIVIADILKEDAESISFQDLKVTKIFTIKKGNGFLKICWNNDCENNKYTFACFHLGILDKISKPLKVDIDSIIYALKLESNFEHLIIHSGRGKTIKSSHWILYMDYSSLQIWVKEGKNLLLQGLYSLKPLKSEVHYGE